MALCYSLGVKRELKNYDLIKMPLVIVSSDGKAHLNSLPAKELGATVLKPTPVAS